MTDRVQGGAMADESSPPIPSGSPAERARDLLQELLERMGMDAEVNVKEQVEQILLEVVGDDASALIGKKGQTLDAFQLLVGKMIGREGGQGTPLCIDAAGYRERRAEALEQLAQRLREKAIATGQVVALNPMSPRDRRTIHMALKDAQGVSTRSEGEGEDRRLLIVPDGELDDDGDDDWADE